MPRKNRRLPARKPKTVTQLEAELATPDPLTEQDRAFLLIYESNGGNATAAYLALHPTVTRPSAATEGYKILRKPEVAQALADDRAEQFARLEMKADEALAVLSEQARLDIGEAYTEDGTLLPPHEWPARLRRCVKSIKPGPYGDAVTFVDPQRAAELMAMAGGKLRGNSLTLQWDHMKYLGAKPPED